LHLQVANQQAAWLAKKIEGRLLNQNIKPFKFEPKGFLVSLGEAKAVGSLAALVGGRWKSDYHGKFRKL
jgi:NADH dehydrogenase FAD-containing subunit